jgi:hypothetical protein
VTAESTALTVVPSAITTVRRPFMKFFPSDWRGDAQLGMCSLAARGLLIELLNLMHAAEPRGYLTMNGVVPTEVELARLVRAGSGAELRRLLKELLDKGVLSVTEDDVIYSRRMVRETARSTIGRETGQQGGNPQLRPKPLRVPDKGLGLPADMGSSNPQKPEARSQNPLPPSGVAGDEDVDELAGAFLEIYPQVYAHCRAGATYRVSRIKQERDLGYARELVRGWPNPERLKAMLEIFLRRTDLGDKSKPGTPGQFLHMAPDCDRLLRENGR